MMEGWKTDKIENIFFLGRGRVINDEEIKDHPGIYPVFSSQTSNNGEFGKVDFYEFEGQYITWTTDGANAGKVFYRSGKFNCTNVCGTLKPKNPEKTDVKFFSYLIDRHAFRHVAVVGNNKLMNNVMGKIKITFPTNVHHQSAIAAMLSKVDEAIASVQASISAAERLKKSLMQNLHTGRMKPDGTLRKEDEFYVDEKFGRVPKGWHWGRLSEIAEIIAGQSPQGEYYNEDGLGCPMLNGPTEFTDKYPIPVQWTTKVTKLCQKGDILFTVRGSSTGRMNFADQEYCIGRGLAAIRPKPNSNIQFIYYTLLKISEMILAEAKGAGTTFPNVSRGDLMKKEILIPDIQEEIVKQICSTENTIILKQNKIAVLERLKKSLMQNLLTGRVRVNELLER